MALEPYSMVRITTDRYRERGIPLGTVGVILEVYNDEAYEVEFIRKNGTTINWFAVRQDEVEAVHGPAEGVQADTA